MNLREGGHTHPTVSQSPEAGERPPVLGFVPLHGQGRLFELPMFSLLPKAAGRLRDLGPGRLVRAVLRRGPHELRCALEELTARAEPVERLLRRLVPGATNAAEATRRIAAGTE